MNPNTLVLILGDVLQAVTNAYGQTGAPDIPARVFTTHGTPVVEGEQLTVSSLGISATHPFPLAQLRAVRSTVVGSAGISIECWRSCWPLPNVTGNVGGTYVDPSAYSKASQALALDAVTVWGWIADLATAGTLVPSIPTIRDSADVSISPMVPLGPQGNVAGWRLQLAVKLSVPLAI